MAGDARSAIDLAHLAWLPLGAVLGFTVSFVFGDLLPLPVDLYYLIYIAAVLGFLRVYVVGTGLDLSVWLPRRLGWAAVLGALGAFVLAQGVLARPPTAGFSGAAFAWAIAWRGVAYGAVDGLLLLAFPWVVVWRALGAERAGWPRKATATALAWGAILLVTTTYHLGYADFRSEKIAQPAIGSSIGAVPTLVAANPVASPIAHVVLHVTAVVHAPASELYLPPHREVDE